MQDKTTLSMAQAPDGTRQRRAESPKVLPASIMMSAPLWPGPRAGSARRRETLLRRFLDDGLEWASAQTRHRLFLRATPPGGSLSRWRIMGMPVETPEGEREK